MAPRRAKGVVQQMVLDYVNNADPALRHTPYSIAKALGLSPGSTHATCRALVRDGALTIFGARPFMVGRVVSDQS